MTTPITRTQQKPLPQEFPKQAPGLDTKKLSGAQRDAYLALKSLFDGYGLGTLATKILEFVQNGYSSDTISVLLQETTEYKQRFAGNEKRKAAGLPVLRPGDYLQVEAAYRQILQSADMPKGFYDSHSDFADWIGTDVSPTEIKERVDMAVSATSQADDQYKEALHQLGFNQGDMAAAFLDQKRALPLLQKVVKTGWIGSEALRQRLNFDPSRAEQWALQGTTREQAAQAYSHIGQFLPDASKLGAIYGDEYSQKTAEDELLGGSAEAARKRKKLSDQETGSFSGQSGVQKGTLTQRTTGSY